MPDDLIFGVRLDGGGSLAGETKAARDELVNLKAATDDLSGAAAKNAEAIARNEEYTRKYKQAVAETIAEHERAAEKIYVVNDAYLKAAGGAKESAIANAGATRELMVLGHEAMTGNFSRMPGTMMVLANRSGLAASGMLGLAAAIAAPIVAMGALAVAIHQGAKEEEEMNRALAMTGDYAGQTAGSLRAMAAQVSSMSSITIGNATGMATAFAASGRIGAEAFQNVMDVSASYARASGEDAGKITEHMIKIFSDPAKAAVELNNKYHFLSVAELNRIETLQETNHLTEAQNLLATTWQMNMDTQVAKLSNSARGWEEIKKAASGAWAAMKGIGQSDDIEGRIKDLQAAFIRNLEGGNAVNAKFYAGEIAKAQAQLAKESADAQAKAAAAASNAEDVYAESVRKSHDPLKARIKLEQDLTVLQDNFRKNAESWSPEEEQAAIRSIRNVRAEIAKIDAPKKVKDEGPTETAKILADIQRQDDALLAIDEDMLIKRAKSWQISEDLLIAMGADGANRRERHEAAITVYFQNELNKRNADSAAAAAKDAETAAKKEAAKAQHMADAMNNEKQYFAKIQAMADDYGVTARSREKLRYDREKIDLDKEHEKTAKAVKENHDLMLAEEEAYQNALGNIKTIHQFKQLQVDQTVLETMLAFKTGNMDEEIGATADYLAKLSSYSASHNHDMFELNKAASIASAIVHTYSAVAGVLDEFPGPEGWAMAAAQAAMGFAQVSAIESTQFGGGGGSAVGNGGSIPSLATSPGVPVSVQNPPPQYSSNPLPALGQAALEPQKIYLTIVGNDKTVFTYDQVVNQLIPVINQAAGNGVNIEVQMMRT